MSKEKLNVVIVDDEPHARKLLKLQLEKHCPDEIAAVRLCSGPAEAKRIVLNSPPDVLFLDIEMPDKDGIEFLNEFGEREFYPVFVTSHAEYALDAIKAHAFDYLLKPVDEEDLITCIGRIMKAVKSSMQRVSRKGKKIELRNVKSIEFVNEEEILLVRAAGSYSEVVTKEKTCVVSKNLKAFADMLCDVRFMRVHNSAIVNLNEVVEFVYEGNYAVISSGEHVMISSRNKDSFLARMTS